MAFTLPVFNLAVNLWRLPDVPPDPPTMVLRGQLYLNSKNSMSVPDVFTTSQVPPLYLRLPPLTDVREFDQVEVPAGTARIYEVEWVEDAHKGFPNEYRTALLIQLSIPQPMP